MRDFLRRPFGRFVVASGVAFAGACTWILAAWLELRGCSLFKQIPHQVTFVVIHLTSFPFAVGWLAAHMNWQFCFPQNSKLTSRLLLLAVLYALMIAVFFFDITSGFLMTYQLKNACSYATEVGLLPERTGDANREADKDALATAEVRLQRAIELKLLEPEIENRETQVQELKDAYNDTKHNKYLMLRQRIGLRGTLAKGNSIVPIAMALTLAFQLSAATAVWCVLLHLANPRSRRATDLNLLRQVKWLTTVIVAFSLWIPARAYANYFEAEHGLIAGDSSSIIFAFFIAAVLLLGMHLDLLMQNDAWWEKAKLAFFVCVSAGGFVLISIPEAGDKLVEAISVLKPIELIAACFVVGAILVLVARNALDRLPA